VFCERGLETNFAQNLNLTPNFPSPTPSRPKRNWLWNKSAASTPSRTRAVVSRMTFRGCRRGKSLRC